MAPGYTEAPVVLWAMEILNLLTGHVDHHFTHLQPWDDREDKIIRNNVQKKYVGWPVNEVRFTSIRLCVRFEPYCYLKLWIKFEFDTFFGSLQHETVVYVV